MQIEDQLPEPGDRQLHRELGIGQHAELIGIAKGSPEQLEAHPHGSDDLDRVVMNTFGDPPALELSRPDELGHQLVPCEGDALLQAGISLCGWVTVAGGAGECGEKRSVMRERPAVATHRRRTCHHAQRDLTLVGNGHNHQIGCPLGGRRP